MDLCFSRSCFSFVTESVESSEADEYLVVADMSSVVMAQLASVGPHIVVDSTASYASITAADLDPLAGVLYFSDNQRFVQISVFSLDLSHELCLDETLSFLIGGRFSRKTSPVQINMMSSTALMTLSMVLVSTQ